MRKGPLVVLLVLFHSAVVMAENDEVTRRINGKYAPDIEDVQESTGQELACDCCQKCKAARKPVLPGLPEEKPGDKNGCEDCCKRCGRPVQPAPEEIPPEIIEKPRSK